MHRARFKVVIGYLYHSEIVKEQLISAPSIAAILPVAPALNAVSLALRKSPRSFPEEDYLNLLLINVSEGSIATLPGLIENLHQLTPSMV